MKHSLAIALTLLVALAAWADTAPTGKMIKAKEALEDAVKKKHIAGAVALVSHKGKVIAEFAVGQQDVEARKAMSTNTLFRIASMTKPITSVAAMILVDDGKLKVTDPIAKYIPEFKNPVVLVKGKDGKFTTEKARRAITVHDLLTHTSGISYRFLNVPGLGDKFVKAEVCDGLSECEGTIGDNVKKIARIPLANHPGEAFHYGLNTDVLGRVVEVASGKTLDEFLRERIFKPLKMNDTYFIVPKDKQARLSALYKPKKDLTIEPVGKETVKIGTLVYTATYPTNAKGKFFSGGGGLTSTASDYHRFCQMMLNKGELDGKRILKADTVALMLKNHTKDIAKAPSFGYGFGIQTAAFKGKGPAIGTYNWGGIFNTAFWVDPKNEVIAVLMTQLYPSGHIKARVEFGAAVYAAIE